MVKSTIFSASTLGILVLLVLAWYAVATPVARLVADELSRLPLSKHAQTGHNGQEWNAETIRDSMGRRECTWKEYVCADTDKEIYYCQVSPSRSIGLVVGRTTRQIITGFVGPTKYWQSRCK
jgi:hypothetical protein